MTAEKKIHEHTVCSLKEYIAEVEKLKETAVKKLKWLKYEKIIVKKLEPTKPEELGSEWLEFKESIVKKLKSTMPEKIEAKELALEWSNFGDKIVEKFKLTKPGEIDAEELELELKKIKAEIWFRGHADSTWKLQPSIFKEMLSEKGAIREEDIKGSLRKDLRRIATGGNTEFRDYAAVRERHSPKDDDPVGQLVHARHYGLDSPLLDWTEASLTGLFFAVEHKESCAEEDKESNAGESCVWVLEPQILNKRWDFLSRKYDNLNAKNIVIKVMADGILKPCDFLNELALEAHLPKTNSDRKNFTEEEKKELLDKLKGEAGVLKEEAEVLKKEEHKILNKEHKIWQEDPKNFVAAFMPQYTSQRHDRQRARFTIHVWPGELKDVSETSEFLTKIIIPHGCRKDILEQLKLAGVTRGSLFPELDALANDVNNDMRRRISNILNKKEMYQMVLNFEQDTSSQPE